MSTENQKAAMQRLLSPVRRAISEHNMISPGDKIAVGLSGGKDSLTMLAALKSYQVFSPEPFELAAVTIDMGFKDSDFAPLTDFCAELGVPYTLIKTDIAEIIFDIRKEKSPCSLCSKMRRGALNTAIQNMGFKKLALGHHTDDLAETFLLSLFFEGRLYVFKPVSFMDRSGVTLIRPMIYCDERDLRSYGKFLPVVHNPCPADKHTRREYMKDLIKSVSKEIPFAKDRLVSAITHPERYSLWDETEKK